LTAKTKNGLIPPIYPFVGRIEEPGLGLKNSFGSSGPQGITIHYTADRDISRVFRELKKNNLRYHLIIDRDGMVTQTAYLNNAVSHAGNASWLGVSPNRRHVAIALVSWGWLTESKEDGSLSSWSGEPVDSLDAEYRKDNIDGKMWWWDKATDKQVTMLEHVCLWFIALGIDPQNIAGHDEAALPLGRKYDPGGVLPTSMREFRKKLEEKSAMFGSL